MSTLKAATKWIIKEAKGMGIQARAIACTIYYIWEARNERIFEGSWAMEAAGLLRESGDGLCSKSWDLIFRCCCPIVMRLVWFEIHAGHWFIWRYAIVAEGLVHSPGVTMGLRCLFSGCARYSSAVAGKGAAKLQWIWFAYGLSAGDEIAGDMVCFIPECAPAISSMVMLLGFYLRLVSPNWYLGFVSRIF
ncbi:hypothetical protein Acr_22g0002620 [Actinidia rufa]|uniref:Uncharacterized protein n=1 Tax=Actinidia rufa TaxID=165716 RepID=A0A7J0GJG0_9ERIC|nr:hypothetical protein Acr_22g0002620 [Actinidia rufa]